MLLSSIARIQIFVLERENKITNCWQIDALIISSCAIIGRYGTGAAARTSTKPKLVDPLEGLTVMQVAMGYGHSLLLAR